MQVQFEDQKWNRPAGRGRAREKGIIGLLIKAGIAKNAAQANIIMIILIVVLCGISYFAISSMHHTPPPPSNIPAQGTAAP